MDSPKQKLNIPHILNVVILYIIYRCNICFNWFCYCMLQERKIDILLLIID